MPSGFGLNNATYLSDGILIRPLKAAVAEPLNGLLPTGCNSNDS